MQPCDPVDIYYVLWIEQRKKKSHYTVAPLAVSASDGGAFPQQQWVDKNVPLFIGIINKCIAVAMRGKKNQLLFCKEIQDFCNHILTAARNVFAVLQVIPPEVYCINQINKYKPN